MSRGPGKIINFQCLYLSLLLVLTACQSKQTSSKEVVPGSNKQTNAAEKSTDVSTGTILCFGNSLTAGYGLEENQAWPALLQDRLDSLDYNYNVINAGLSGETTSGGLNRLDWVLNRKVNIFILELGANDMLRGLDVRSTRENLDRIIKKVVDKNPGVSIVLAGLLSPPNMGQAYEREFNSIYPELSEKYKASLIPFFLQNVALVDSLNLPDGKHPNEKGQEIVLENVWKHLQPLLEKEAN